MVSDCRYTAHITHGFIDLFQGTIDTGLRLEGRKESDICSELLKLHLLSHQSCMKTTLLKIIELKLLSSKLLNLLKINENIAQNY